MRRRTKSPAKKEATAPPARIEGEPLHPVRVVERVLTRPDGTTCKVEVPVYPPFQLKKRAAKSARSRKTRPDW